MFRSDPRGRQARRIGRAVADDAATACTSLPCVAVGTAAPWLWTCCCDWSRVGRATVAKLPLGFLEILEQVLLDGLRQDVLAGDETNHFFASVDDRQVAHANLVEETISARWARTEQRELHSGQGQPLSP